MSDDSNAVSFLFEIKNTLGLHARPASMLVEVASTFDAEVFLEKVGEDGEVVNAKSLIGILMLSAGFGAKVRVRAEGVEADNALAAIAELFERKFDEE